MEQLIDFQQVTKDFPLAKTFFGRVTETLRAVDKVTFSIDEGTTLGIVGESGCGKTTIGRMLLRLIGTTEGTIKYKGLDIWSLSPEELGEFRRSIQAVFQNPFSSLSPRMKVRDIVGEPMIVQGLVEKAALSEKVAELLETVGLSPDDQERYPHQFSGGQRQRIAIARALSSNPKLIVLDEPVSALDVSIRAQILNLLRELQKRFGLTYVFIAHDLILVNYMSDQVIVIYQGRIMEMGDTTQVFNHPAHPYTNALLAAVPLPDPTRQWAEKEAIVGGDAIDVSVVSEGCQFQPRCKYAFDRCSVEIPELVSVGPDHLSACYRKTVNGNSL